MNTFYGAIWDFFEDLYHMTGIDLAAPILFVWPGFAPWLFGKMIGVKGVRIEK